MRILIVIFIIIPTFLSAQKKANWETQFFFEDALGNKDTITLGHDIDANFDYNPDFGEVNIEDVPWDTIFEVRATHDEGANEHASPRVLSKKIIGPSNLRWNSSLTCLSIREVLHFYVKAKHLPLKITWNKEDYNRDCEIFSYMAPHDLAFVSSFWFLDTFAVQNTQAYSCLSETNEYIINNFAEVHNNFFRFILESNNTSIPDTIYGFGVYLLDKNTIVSPCIDPVNTEDLIDYDVKIQAYPNPTSSVVHIDLQGAFSWKLYNVQGVGLLSGKEQEINMDALPGGMYFLEINTGRHIVSKRIVKNE